jgi:hypothetical protein
MAGPTFTEIQGFNCKVLINGVNYVAQKVRIRATVQESSTTNFEGGGFAESKDTIERCEVEITQASFDPNNNPFGAPVVVTPRSIIDLQVYPDDLDSVPWHLPRAQIFELSHEADAEGLQPISMTVRSQGLFFYPMVA